MSPTTSPLKHFGACAFLGCFVLFAGSIACTAAEPTNLIDTYRTTPASVFDIFLLAVNTSIEGTVDNWLTDTTVKVNAADILDYVNHNVPKDKLNELKTHSLLSFASFSYDETEDSFTAFFSVLPFPNHPVYQTGLRPEDDESRVKFAKSVFRLANDATCLGVTSGVTSIKHHGRKVARDGISPLSMRKDVGDRTTIKVMWPIRVDAPASMPSPPKVFTELAKLGIYARNYMISGPLQDEGKNDTGSIAVTYRDARSEEESMEQLKGFANQ